MKRNLFLILPAAFAALLFPSCAGPGGGLPTQSPVFTEEAAPAMSGGLRSGDQAANRNNIDAMMGNRPQEEKRPGLATGWGDEKTSHIHDVGFTRASSKPAGIDAIYYNDKDGLRAMSRFPSSTGPMQQAAGGLVEWGIKGGYRFLPAYKEWGYGRRLVAGEKNGSYAIVVKNRCKSPLEIVASVDGLDVMDGGTASFSKRGYIVDSGKTVTISGFRTSESSIASFKFSGVSNSYANMRHGETRNVGVIGLAVFTKKGVNPWTWMPDEVKRRGSARAFAEAP
ncbi:hypothetical protein OVA24_13395 [Luteolibacter sp. SL250]|uniref:hypothetical protein n=1 Tax=Luteolibacter sp. SL250 TaxID=2995170 RepID=UPI00226FCA8F|nr:hypothetical protein [Luteolibacter sp. SL250]WAC18232.1 hypothetical protein OVA24_13395 [Luteolibacter sp. SL250]